MLPWWMWKEALSQKSIEKAQRKVRWVETGRWVGPWLRGCGAYLHHLQIRAESLDLYVGVGFTSPIWGNQIFLKDVRQGLQIPLGCPVGAKA